MKKLLLILGIVVVSFSLVSCKDDEEPEPNNDDKKVDVQLAETFASIAKDKQIFLTTTGQADIDIVQNIIEAATSLVEGVDYTRNEMLPFNTENVPNGSVVFLVTGTSGKGLGAAGTNVDGEKARATGFGARAVAGDITLIVLHVGGVGRRGSSTDPILNAVCPSANLLLVVLAGDSDNLFTNFNKDYSVPLYLFSKATNMVGAFSKLID